MDFDEFEIIIKKNGDMLVRIDGLEEKKFKHYREILEEAVGPVRERIEISDDAMPPGETRLSETDKHREDEKSEEKLQH